MFIVKLAKGTAVDLRNTKKGQVRIRNYLVFVDEKGAYIETRKERIYLTDKNSIFK